MNRLYISGEKNTRYIVSCKGQKVIEPGSQPDQYGRLKYQHTTQRSYCFDFDILKNLYGINFHEKSDTDNDKDNDEDE